MRLLIKIKLRIATIYINKNFHFKLADEENIIGSDKNMKRIVQRWQNTGN